MSARLPQQVVISCWHRQDSHRIARPKSRGVEENGVYATYTSKDGVVIIGIQNEREWAVFCDKVLGDPVLPSDPRFNANAKRNENRAAPDALILEVFQVADHPAGGKPIRRSADRQRPHERYGGPVVASAAALARSLAQRRVPSRLDSRAVSARPPSLRRQI